MNDYYNLAEEIRILENERNRLKRQLEVVEIELNELREKMR
jgi:hypothetical protein